MVWTHPSFFRGCWERGFSPPHLRLWVPPAAKPWVGVVPQNPGCEGFGVQLELSPFGGVLCYLRE